MSVEKKSLTPEIPEWSISECGGANFVVTWTAMDLNGQMATCTQNVVIGNIADATVTRPALEITLASCGAGTEPDDIPNSQPIVNNVDCEKINITWEDKIEAGTGSECVRILRTWAIIDWCKFDGGNVGSAILDQFVQTILISDDVMPVMDCPMATTVADTNDDCQELVTVGVSATDDCTPSDLLTFTYEIDLDDDGSVDQSGEGASITYMFPVGVHSVTFAVADACGNVERCTTGVTVTSSKAPQPLCVGLTEAVISTSGVATISAASLNVKSTTGCTLSEEGLSFSFSPTEVVPEMTFDCEDIGNGIFDEQTVEIWVIDDATGAAAACQVIISISDRQNDFCADNSGASLLSGFVSDEDQAVVKEIPVMVENMVTGELYTTMTDDEGFYSFANLMTSENYKVNPQFEDYPLAGISTLDIVLIQQHILGLRMLNSPYKLHAADVNNSNSVSAIDIVSLRRLILGLTDQLPNDNWKFFDKNFEFDMANDPWTYDDHIMVNNASAVEADRSFIGVKVGDVNGNAFGAVATGTAGPRSTTQFDVKGERNGDLIRYSFSTENAESILGLQLAIDLESNMELLVIGSDNMLMGSEHFSQVGNELRISWTGQEAIDVEGKDLFFIDVRSIGTNVPELALVNRSLYAEIYNEDFERSSIVLNSVEGDNLDGVLLMQISQTHSGIKLRFHSLYQQELMLNSVLQI